MDLHAELPTATVASLGEFVSYLDAHCGHKDLLFRAVAGESVVDETSAYREER